MMNSTPRSLLLLVKVSLVLTLIVIVLGAYTRLSDAGLGCPDWPGCYGKLVVPSGESAVANANLEYPERALEADKAWIEMVHRYFAGSLGLLIFAVSTFTHTTKATKPITPIDAANINTRALLSSPDGNGLRLVRLICPSILLSIK